MGKFASGRESWAISDRSGFRYPYRLMKKEWNGLLVGPDEFEPKQPQLGPFRKVVDPEALKNARPDRVEPLDVYVGVPLVISPNLLPVQAFGTDYSLLRLSRDGFLTIPNKTTQGRVNQFFLDRQISPNLKLWPVPDNDTDVVYYDALTRMDDADIYTNTMDLPFRFYPCLAAGLAYYLALKRAPNRVEMLKAIYEEEFERAAVEDRDRASFNVAPQFDYYRIG
jgi:hypothetical protein